MDNILLNISKYYDVIICNDIPGHGENACEFNVENSLNYTLKEYDKVKNYDRIDVLGYSLGGVLAVFLQSVRRIDNLFLIAPALYYIFPGNLKFFKYKNKTKNSFDNCKFLYFIEFVKISSYVKNEINKVSSNTYLFIGEDDYLVSYKSVKTLFNICSSEKKGILTIEDTTHTSILNSEKMISNLEDIIKNKWLFSIIIFILENIKKNIFFSLNFKC